MKPVSLELQAFGPFARRERVDFTLLGEHPLFLIHGPTGAGKSSLLDAICVALFGDSSGGERRAADLRSHHAPEDLPTEVVFEFELGSARFRATRAPEQQRASRRARAGHVTEKPRATLERWRDGRWEAIAARPADVDARVQQLLGFDAAQFRQVLMLPQGQFRRVLTADSAERERILETLFATDACKRLQEALQARDLALREAFTLARRDIDVLLGQRGLESPVALDDAIAQAGARLDRLGGELAVARQRAEAADAALASARLLATRFSEQASALEALGALDAQADEFARLRRGRDRARRALGVEADYGRAVDARARLEAARLALAQSAETFAAAQRDLAAAREALAIQRARGDEIEARRAQVRELESLRERIAQLGVASEGWRRAEASLAAALEAAAGAETTLASLRDALAADEAKRAALDAAAHSVEAREARRDEIARSLAVSVSLAQAREALARALELEREAGGARDRAARGLAAAEDALARAQATWRASRARELASALVDGVPCPVCGSREHPGPASAAGVDASGPAIETVEAAVRAARAEDRAAAAALHEARTRSAAETSRVEERMRHLGAAPADPEALREAEAALEQAREARAMRDSLHARAQARRQALQAAEAGRHARAQDVEAARSAVAAARATFDERSVAVPEAWRDPGRLDRALTEHREALVAYDTAARGADEALREAERTGAAARALFEQRTQAMADAEAAARDARAGLARALAAAEFGDERAFLEARVAGDRIAALDAALAGYDEARAAARERVARAAAAVAGLVPPDLDTCQRASAEARALLDALNASHRECELAIEADRRLAGRLRTQREALDALERDYARVGTLAGLAAGRNPRRMTFQRYVLGALLDDVLRQASERLLAMTRGRYWLRRRIETGDLRRAQGLDLEVFDDYTGRPRAVATLSGGEGFLAALALALGLSDVVQSHAGGVRLDTLFVDEGFGSLDPEALDMALRALLELRAQGRTVGVISHVDELRQQIGVGIEVVAGASGSRVRCHGPMGIDS